MLAAGDAVVLSGAVTVSVLILGDGATRPNWDVIGIIVTSKGVGVVL